MNQARASMPGAQPATNTGADAGERAFDIVVVGDLNADLVLRGAGTPRFGQVETLVEDATLTLGSSAGIFACAAARLGLRAAIIGKVGQDALGDFVLHELTQRNVDVSGVVRDHAIKTGISVILSQGQDRAILTYAGSIAALQLADIDQTLIAQAHHLHLASYYLLDGLLPGVPQLFAAARAQGLTTSLDTNYDPHEHWQTGLDAVLAQTNVLLPNQTEVQALTGEAQIEAAARQLAVRVPTVVVKCGAAGAVGCQGNDVIAVDSPLVEVVDTTGAGDTFDAGYIYGMLAGWSMERSMRAACICGALSTRADGGTAAQPTVSQLLEAL